MPLPPPFHLRMRHDVASTAPGQKEGSCVQTDIRIGTYNDFCPNRSHFQISRPLPLAKVTPRPRLQVSANKEEDTRGETPLQPGVKGGNYRIVIFYSPSLRMPSPLNLSFAQNFFEWHQNRLKTWRRELSHNDHCQSNFSSARLLVH